MIAYSAALTLLALFLPLMAAVLAPALINRLGYRASWLLALMPFLSFLHFLSFLPEIADGGEVTGGYAWVPSYNVSFSWYLDGLSLTFALLITGIGTLIVLYAGAYMKGHAQQGRFLAFLLLFMGAMLGLVMSDSFLMLFIYWELTSITSFVLAVLATSGAAGSKLSWSLGVLLCYSMECLVDGLTASSGCVRGTPSLHTCSSLWRMSCSSSLPAMRGMNA
jgi:NADH:ubiquinone oxidoreductase subunit 5 (subunit L)/multisubunit Na+/H+ antiporter MnhA subunit